MTNIAIITDSTCNIPPEMVKQYKLYVVPQHLIWGMEDLLDLKDITPSQFYERLVKDPVHPKTSQPPVLEFASVIKQAKKDGAKEVLIITISDKLSGTYASAKQAASEADIKVEMHDSRSVAMGLGWQVIAAARAREKGADIKGIIAAAEAARQKTTVMLTLDTLDFLHKGGRIGGAKRLVGTALNIKPRLVVNAETGVVDTGESTRTRGKAVEATYQAFRAKLDASKQVHIGVHHAKVPAECEALADRVRKDFPKAELVVNEITPVLGTHGGPGTLALCGYYED